MDTSLAAAQAKQKGSVQTAFVVSARTCDAGPESSHPEQALLQLMLAEEHNIPGNTHQSTRRNEQGAHMVLWSISSESSQVLHRIQPQRTHSGNTAGSLPPVPKEHVSTVRPKCHCHCGGWVGMPLPPHLRTAAQSAESTGNASEAAVRRRHHCECSGLHQLEGDPDGWEGPVGWGPAKCRGSRVI